MVDNASENESEGSGELRSREENSNEEEEMEMRENEFAREDCMEESVHVEHVVVLKNN